VRVAWRPQFADSGDEMVLEAAVNRRADALVICNLADFSATAPRFGLALLKPGELLERIGRRRPTPSSCRPPSTPPQRGLRKEDGVSVNQRIASPVAQRIGAVETAAEFFRRRAKGAKPGDLCDPRERARSPPRSADELTASWRPRARCRRRCATSPTLASALRTGAVAGGDWKRRGRPLPPMSGQWLPGDAHDDGCRASAPPPSGAAS
jgi:hypothetical protein